MGAVAFQKGLGACHSLAHPLSNDLRTASRPRQRALPSGGRRVQRQGCRARVSPKPPGRWGPKRSPRGLSAKLRAIARRQSGCPDALLGWREARAAGRRLPTEPSKTPVTAVTLVPAREPIFWRCTKPRCGCQPVGNRNVAGGCAAVLRLSSLCELRHALRNRYAAHRRYHLCPRWRRRLAGRTT